MKKKARSIALAEKPKRLVPKPDVFRKLYLLSGNVCAHPGCSNVLINRDGVMVGDICHIEGVEGPRFNPSMTNDQRRAAANLIMLCKAHHAAVDGNETKYTVTKLKAMKKKHEAKFAEVDERLQQGFIEQFTDHTDSLAPTYPKNLKGLRSLHESGWFTPKVLEEVHDYIRKLSIVPDREREFILALIRRAAKLGWNRRGAMFNSVAVSVSTDDIRSALNIGDHKIKKLGEALERYGVGGLADVDYGKWEVFAADPSDYVGWADIADLAESNNIDIERFILHLEFGRLDGK